MQIRHLFEKFFGTEIRHTVVTSLLLITIVLSLIAWVKCRNAPRASPYETKCTVRLVAMMVLCTALVILEDVMQLKYGRTWFAFVSVWAFFLHDLFIFADGCFLIIMDVRRNIQNFYADEEMAIKIQVEEKLADPETELSEKNVANETCLVDKVAVSRVEICDICGGYLAVAPQCEYFPDSYSQTPLTDIRNS